MLLIVLFFHVAELVPDNCRYHRYLSLIHICITGLKTEKVCADFETFYKIRKKPLKPVETYSGKVLQPSDYEEVPIDTEDYATVLIKFDNGAHGSFTVNQVAAGRKNRMYFFKIFFELICGFDYIFHLSKSSNNSSALL